MFKNMFKNRLIAFLMIMLIFFCSVQIVNAQATRQYFSFTIVDINGEEITDGSIYYNVDSGATLYETYTSGGDDDTDEVTNPSTLPTSGYVDFWLVASTVDVELYDADGNQVTYSNLTPRDSRLVWPTPFDKIYGMELDDSDALTTFPFVYQCSVDCTADTSETVSIITLPIGSILLDVISFVETALDGDTTTTFEVGVSGNTDAYIDSVDYDESTDNTFISMTGGTSNDIKAPQVLNTATEIIATYVNDADPTEGNVEITVIYIP